MRKAVLYVAAALLAAALVRHFYELGGPYFAAPETIQDHVAKVPFPSRDAIVLCRRAALILPRGARVTVLMPSQAPNYDITLCYTATGLMPHHRVVAPTANAQYVISVREPFPDPRYRLLTEFREGNIYERQ